MVGLLIVIAKAVELRGVAGRVVRDGCSVVLTAASCRRLGLLWKS